MNNALFLLVFLCACTASDNSAQQKSSKLLPPSYGMYHGAFQDFGATEDVVTESKIKEFDSLSGNPAIWAYFSNNWYGKISFPTENVNIIKKCGKIPYIRMMPRTDFLESQPDPVYKMQNIIDGKFDNDLIKWAEDAKNCGTPLIIEFGTEVNGDWFPWNGKYNGGGRKTDYGSSDLADGPERFQDAYIHIIEIFRDNNVNNVTWVYHINYDSSPDKSWNNMSAYYPGDDYIDWIGVSVYGSQFPGDDWNEFTDLMNDAYQDIISITSSKPIALVEFGVCENPDKGDKADWIKNALMSLVNLQYPRIKAISIWSSIFDNDDGPVTDMRINSSKIVADTYKSLVNTDFFKPQILWDNK